MGGIARVGKDTAGGRIIGNLAPTVQVDNSPVVVKGAVVESHGDSPHDSATMTGASATVFANGKAISRAGDAASCGDIATGSSDVSAG